MSIPGENQRKDNSSGSNATGKGYGEFAWKVFLAAMIVAGSFLILILLWAAAHIFLILFGAVMMTVFIRGLSDSLRRRLRLPDFLSVMIVIFALGGISYFTVSVLAPHVAAQAGELGQKLPSAFMSLQGSIERTPFGRQIVEKIPNVRDLLKGGELLQDIKGIFSVTFAVVADAFIFFFASLYLSFNPGIYTAGFLRLVPARRRERARAVIRALDVTLHRWLMGRLMGMALVGLLSGVSLSLIGIPLALTLGLFAGLLTFIPYLGAIVSAVPAMLLGLLDHPVKAVYVAGLYLLIHTIEAYFVTPMIQQHQVLLPPVFIIFAQILFALSTGLLGLMLATPLTAAVVVLVKMLYIEDVLGEAANVPGEG